MKKLILLLLFLPSLAWGEIIGIGDSMMWGLCQVSPEIECCAVPGQSTLELARILRPKSGAEYIIHTGTACIAPGNESKVLDAIEIVLNKLKDNQVIIILPSMRAPRDPVNRSIGNLRHGILDEATARSNVRYIDLFDMRKRTTDGIHFDAETNMRIWKRIMLIRKRRRQR